MRWDIQLVTLDNYYLAHLSNPKAHHYFADLVEMRTRGYGMDYPNYYLPLDATDFVSVQHLFYLKDDLAPQGRVVGCMKFVSLRTADFYQLNLPLMKTVLESGQIQHLKVLEKIFEVTRDQNLDLLYPAGLTIEKSLRDVEELRKIIIELVAALVCESWRSQQLSRMVTAAVVKFKTSRFIKKMGFQNIQNGPENLSPILKKTANEMIELLELHAPSVWASDCYDQYCNILEQRIWIHSRESFLNKAA